MKKVKYTPDAADKLRDINRRIMMMYDRDMAKAVVSKITNAIKGLSEHEKKGPSVENILGIDSEYRYLFVSRNYVFYKIEEDCIRIINIYNEKEDFMWRLFGIDTTSQETLDYWDE